MRSILVTSAGSGVGQAVFEAMECSAHAYRLVVLNSHALAPIFHHANAAYLSPNTSQKKDFEQCLKTVVALEKPDLILAGRDEELELLARLSGEWSQQGAQVAGSSAELMAACVDKYLTFQHLKHILPMVETASTAAETQALLQRWGFPLLLKPRSGFASRGVLVVHTPALLAAFLAEVQEDYIVQPYLSKAGKGSEENLWPEYSGQIVIGVEGTVLGIFASQVRVVQGVTVRLKALASDTPFAQELLAIAQRMAVMGFRGAYNLQGIETQAKGLQLIEINGRCTGLTGVRAQMGFNEVDMLYDSFVRRIMPDFCFGNAGVAVMQHRFEQIFP